jgi:hypothetical protein
VSEDMGTVTVNSSCRECNRNEIKPAFYPRESADLVAVQSTWETGNFEVQARLR